MSPRNQKKKINKPILQKLCLQAAKQAEDNKNYDAASWYYLLAGKIDYLFTHLEKHIDSTSTAITANIAHAYILSGDIEQAKKRYQQFLQVADIPWADSATQYRYYILKKLFPNKKKKLKQGLQLWNTLYTPFLKIKAIANKAKAYSKQHKYGLSFIFREAVR